MPWRPQFPHCRHGSGRSDKKICAADVFGAMPNSNADVKAAQVLNGRAVVHVGTADLEFILRRTSARGAWKRRRSHTDGSGRRADIVFQIRCIHKTLQGKKWNAVDIQTLSHYNTNQSRFQ
jgi:hypothetical protein